MGAIKIGTPADQAFGTVFGDSAALDKELRNYVRNFMFSAVRLDLGEQVDGGTMARGEPIAEPQVAAYLSDVLVRLGRADAARTQLRALLEKDASLARAACVLGQIELREKRYDEALRLLEQGAAAAPADTWIQTAFASALIRRGEQDPDADTTRWRSAPAPRSRARSSATMRSRTRCRRSAARTSSTAAIRSSRLPCSSGRRSSCPAAKSTARCSPCARAAGRVRARHRAARAAGRSRHPAGDPRLRQAAARRGESGAERRAEPHGGGGSIGGGGGRASEGGRGARRRAG